MSGGGFNSVENTEYRGVGNGENRTEKDLPVIAGNVLVASPVIRNASHQRRSFAASGCMRLLAGILDSYSDRDSGLKGSGAGKGTGASLRSVS